MKPMERSLRSWADKDFLNVTEHLSPLWHRAVSWKGKLERNLGQYQDLRSLASRIYRSFY